MQSMQLYVSVLLKRFESTENLDDAASAINHYTEEGLVIRTNKQSDQFLPSWRKRVSMMLQIKDLKHALKEKELKEPRAVLRVVSTSCKVVQVMPPSRCTCMRSSGGPCILCPNRDYWISLDDNKIQLYSFARQ